MKRLACAAVFASAVVSSACVGVREYHAAHPVMALRDTSGVSLAYVEFDDNGELFDRHELDATVEELARVVQTPSGADVVIFVHGWKNDADNSGNVSGFQRFLREIHDAKPQRPLVGVYMAWRGSSLRLAQNLTYWNRSLATTRVGGAHFEEALFRMIRAVKAPAGGGAAPSTLVVIGHSFGGRVLEHTLTPYLESVILAGAGEDFGRCIDRSVPSIGTPRTTVNPPVPDLAVLLNEAAPATDAKPLLELLTCHDVRYERTLEGGGRVPAPLLLSITSDGDAATGVALPGGQFIGRTQLKTRQYDPPHPDRPWEGPAEVDNQSTYYTHSTAHTPALHSHVFRYEAQACSTSAVDLGRGSTIPIQGLDPYHLCVVPMSPTPRGSGPPAPYWNHTPYWVFKIPIEIVPNHTDIFRKELLDLLAFFMPSAGTVGELTVP